MPFGTYYLAQQKVRFDGRDDVALAGYNGGPGNAQLWLEAAGDDPDLFLELVAFSETRSYIRLIKELDLDFQQVYARNDVQMSKCDGNIGASLAGDAEQNERREQEPTAG